MSGSSAASPLAARLRSGAGPLSFVRLGLRVLDVSRIDGSESLLAQSYGVTELYHVRVGVTRLVRVRAKVDTYRDQSHIIAEVLLPGGWMQLLSLDPVDWHGNMLTPAVLISRSGVPTKAATGAFDELRDIVEGLALSVVDVLAGVTI